MAAGGAIRQDLMRPRNPEDQLAGAAGPGRADGTYKVLLQYKMEWWRPVVSILLVPAAVPEDHWRQRSYIIYDSVLKFLMLRAT